MALIKKEGLLLGNYNAEVLTYEPEGPPNDLHVVIIPGNPGMADFYRNFMLEIIKRYPTVPISTISHAGHTNGIGYDSGTFITTRGVFSLQDQIDHKLKFLEHLQTQHKQNNENQKLSENQIRFILIGHSVGGYICMKMRLAKKYPIVQVINLFSTFQYLYEGLAPTIQWLIQPGLRNFAAMLSGFVPLSWKRYLVREYSTGLCEETQNIVASGFNRYSVLNNVLYMAKTEGIEIREIDPELIKPFESTLFIYGTSDRYTPMTQINQFRVEYPEANVVMAPDECTHAFCVNPKESVIVANLVIEYFDSHGPLSDI